MIVYAHLNTIKDISQNMENIWGAISTRPISTRESISAGVKMFWKSSILRMVLRKNLHRCNQREALRQKISILKKYWKPKVGQWLPNIFSPSITISLGPGRNPKTGSPVSALWDDLCRVCGLGSIPVYLWTAETRCWGLCGPLLRSTALSPKYQEQYRRNHREAGEIAQPPGGVFRPWQRSILSHSALAKCPGQGQSRRFDSKAAG